MLGLRRADFDADSGTIAVTGKAVRVAGEGMVRVDETKSAAGGEPSSWRTSQRTCCGCVGGCDPDNFNRPWRQVRDELGAAGVSTHSFAKPLPHSTTTRGSLPASAPITLGARKFR